MSFFKINNNLLQKSTIYITKILILIIFMVCLDCTKISMQQINMNKTLLIHNRIIQYSTQSASFDHLSHLQIKRYKSFICHCKNYR